MPNSRSKRVVVHHPELKAQETVRQAQADVLAASGWKSGPLPNKTAVKAENKGVN